MSLTAGVKAHIRCEAKSLVDLAMAEYGGKPDRQMYLLSEIEKRVKEKTSAIESAVKNG